MISMIWILLINRFVCQVITENKEWMYQSEALIVTSCLYCYRMYWPIDCSGEQGVNAPIRGIVTSCLYCYGMYWPGVCSGEYQREQGVNAPIRSIVTSCLYSYRMHWPGDCSGEYHRENQIWMHQSGALLHPVCITIECTDLETVLESITENKEWITPWLPWSSNCSI